jgi:hypothetical protein
MLQIVLGVDDPKQALAALRQVEAILAPSLR